MSNQKGFTLIELMIVVAIIAILAGIGMPSYQQYVRNAEYSEVTAIAGGYTAKVMECVTIRAAVADCDAGEYGIPAAIATGNGSDVVDTVTVTDGVIVATATALYDSSTFTLTATNANGVVSMAATCNDQQWCPTDATYVAP